MTESRAATDHADVVIMPPALYGLAVLAGIVARGVFGGEIAPGEPVRMAAGLALMGIGVVFMALFTWTFRRAGERKNPRTPTRHLLTGGIYRVSRNPAYVALAFLLAGFGVASDNPWMVAMLLVTLPVIHFGVILREEAYLERAFGEEYLAYKRRVRRYL